MNAILVIEEDANLASTIVDVLREEGYDADCVGNHEDARVKLHSRRLVLIDGMVGEPSVREFISELGALPTAPRVIVLVATKPADALAKQFGLPAITLPFDVGSLVEEVARGGARPRRVA
jgi:DNA-binding response OmpR family regulator